MTQYFPIIVDCIIQADTRAGIDRVIEIFFNKRNVVDYLGFRAFRKTHIIGGVRIFTKYIVDVTAFDGVIKDSTDRKLVIDERPVDIGFYTIAEITAFRRSDAGLEPGGKLIVNRFIGNQADGAGL